MSNVNLPLVGKPPPRWDGSCLVDRKGRVHPCQSWGHYDLSRNLGYEGPDEASQQGGYVRVSGGGQVSINSVTKPNSEQITTLWGLKLNSPHSEGYDQVWVGGRKSAREVKLTDL